MSDSLETEDLWRKLEKKSINDFAIRRSYESTVSMELCVIDRVNTIIPIGIRCATLKGLFEIALEEDRKGKLSERIVLALMKDGTP